jgi:cytoskeletal protein CcmA (bactofilin family)
MFRKLDQISKGSSVAETIIGPSVRVEGNFVGQGDIIVEGEVKGALQTKNNVRIGPKAQVRANIKGASIFVAGQVRGNIKAKEKVELSSQAKVFGDLETKTLSIAPGAFFNGRCIMAEIEEKVESENKSK